MTAKQCNETDRNTCRVGGIELNARTGSFYRQAMTILAEAEVPALVGGAYALERYTGVSRHTKDFDVFIRREDAESALTAFSEAGFKSELTFQHWLGKAYNDDLFIDMIFASANGVVQVDDEWFTRATDGVVLGMHAKLCPPEEIIRAKCFVLERERYDGADVAHLLRSCANSLDWRYLIERFGSFWRALFNQLVLFRFIYPAERNSIPQWVMRELLDRVESDLGSSPPTERVCMGTVLSREQFLVDTHEWGYRDGRLRPQGNMTQADIDRWTAAIDEAEHHK